MFGVKIKNKFLELMPNTAFAFRLSSPAYLGDKIDEFSNALIFSTKVPLDGDNEAALQYPHVLANEWRFLKNEPCEVWKNGHCVFMGDLIVTSATAELVREPTATIQIVINTISRLKELKMNELDMGYIDLGNTVNLLGHCTQTCINPLLYPYIFYQVWNPSFYVDKAEEEWSDDEFQNKWDVNDGSQPIGKVVQRNRSTLTPHLRIDYILKKMFEHVGFEIDNKWQIDDELRLLTLYNNATLCRPDGTMPNALFYLNKGLPDLKCSEFIGQLCRKFALVPFTNLFAKTVELVPFKDVLSRAPKHDWTEYAQRGGDITEKNNYPSKLSDKKSADSIVPDLTDVPRFHYPVQLISDPTGVYLNNGVWEYHETTNQPNFQKTVLVDFEDFARFDGDNEAWETEVGYPSQTRFVYGGIYSSALAPGIRHRGTYEAPDASAQHGYKAERNAPPIRLLFYRGLHEYQHEGRPFPIVNLASGETTGLAGQRMMRGWNSPSLARLVTIPPQFVPKPTRYALTWSGEDGTFNRFWVTICDFLKEKRDITLRLSLPLSALLTFSFADKVRIGNMEFLVKELRGTLREQGELIEIEADLVTTV